MVIAASPMDMEKLNKLIMRVADDIIDQVKEEHLKHGLIGEDPILISLNAYNLTMNFTAALNSVVISKCMEAQHKFNQ